MIPAPPKPDGPPVVVEARCVRLSAKADEPASLAPGVERRPLSRGANELLIEVKAAAVNPSDVKAATGLMPYAVFPRTPGRDYAGIVIDGPADWIGREVFGSSGDFGIRRDGTHATHLAVEAGRGRETRATSRGRRRPASACPSSPRWKVFAARHAEPGETVLVLGVNGKVGQAAVQIAADGARVIGVVRKAGHTRDASARSKSSMPRRTSRRASAN